MKENLVEIVALYSDNIPVADFTETAKFAGGKLDFFKNASKEIRFTICAFGSGGAKYKKVCENTPAGELAPEKLFSVENSYKVAMIDSAVKLAEELGARYRDTPPEEIPGEIVFVIVVFGKDNASKKHTYKELREVIEHQTAVYGWRFYIVTDTPSIAEKLGFPDGDAVFAPTDTEGFFPQVINEICDKIIQNHGISLKGT
ncbi:MAG: hypothetical protein LBI38_02570 [Oscillospiraceae bacterium]|jgi:hypothetical protein|nr:hypothetical protein [Oscillospiraceae bacterium]